jgi:hypothetical protein
MRDHCVPTKELASMVSEQLENAEFVAVANLVERFCRVVYVTAEEGILLDRRPPQGIGLRDRMPDGWNHDGEEAHLARYRAAKICIADELPDNFVRNLSGRKSEMDYAKRGWSPEDAAGEIITLWNAELKAPDIPIRAILVGFSHVRVQTSVAYNELYAQQQ